MLEERGWAVLEELEKPTGVPTPCHAVPLVCLPDGNTKPLCVRHLHVHLSSFFYSF